MNNASLLTCEEMLRRLGDYLDHELDPARVSQVEAHLALCEVCAREYSFEGRLLDGIRDKLRNPAVPASLAQKIADALRTDEATEGR